jgi:hypothetical protein
MGYDDELISGVRVKDTGAEKGGPRMSPVEAARLVYNMEPGERRERWGRVSPILEAQAKRLADPGERREILDWFLNRAEPYTEHVESQQARASRTAAANRLRAESAPGYDPRDPEGVLEPLRPGERDYWASLLSARGGSGPDTGNALVDGMSVDDVYLGPPEAPPEAPAVELGPPEAPMAEIDREIERLQELRARKEASATYYRMKK